MAGYERALRRVEEDLARGHTHLAIQRLSSVLTTAPTDLTVRAQLASIHLQTGNLVEAGRWGFFNTHRDVDATRAFERAFPDPQLRLRALRWPERAERDTPLLVHERIAEVRSATWDGQRAVASQPRARTVLGYAGMAVALVFAVGIPALIVIGVVTVLRWIL